MCYLEITKRKSPGVPSIDHITSPDVNDLIQIAAPLKRDIEILNHIQNRMWTHHFGEIAGIAAELAELRKQHYHQQECANRISNNVGLMRSRQFQSHSGRNCHHIIQNNDQLLVDSS
jgi:hypothetical protein